MSSTFETGHAKNVANFESIVSFCKAYAGKYIPSKASLTIQRLDAKLADAKFILLTAKEGESHFKNSSNARLEVFSNLRTLATQVMAATQASEVSKETVKDVRSVNRKLQGQKVTRIVQPQADATTAMPTPRTISSSQRSFDLQLDHFQKIISLLTADGRYNPNEPELNITGLQAKAAAMIAANTAVIDAKTTWSNARIQRDKILYDEASGLKAVADEVKSYVRSIFGAASDEYKQISGLSFRDVKR